MRRKDREITDKNRELDPILLIEFTKPQDYFDIMFDGKQYKIVGKDDVGNYIGQDSIDTLFYLEKEPTNIRYIANNLGVLVKQLVLYKEYGEKPEEDWEMSLQKFRERIMSLDANAFQSPENFWSVIVEQMEYELL